MFFGRFGQKPSVESLSCTVKARHRRRLAVVSVAVAVVLPAGVVELAKLYAQDVQPLSSQELLAQGEKQLASQEYEEAVATLKQIQPGNLSDADKKKYEKALAKAQTGADGRTGARSEYDAGETALAAGDLGTALNHYHSAASNPNADAGTHQKALEKIALVNSQRKNDATADSHLYDAGAADYKAGHYEAAQAKFETLKAHDYHVHMFEWSPEDYLRHIHAKMATAPKPVAVADAPAESPAPTTAPAAPDAPAAPEATAAPAAPQAPAVHELSAREYYDRGRHEYKTGDWIAARRDLTKAQEAGYHAGMFQETPAKMLAAIDKKEAADEQRDMTAAERRRAHEQQLAAAETAPATTEPASVPPMAEASGPTTAPSEEASTTPPAATQEAMATPPAAPQEAMATPAAPETPTTAPVATEQPAAAPAPVEPPPPVVQPSSPPSASSATPAQQALSDTTKLEQIRQQERVYQASQLVDQARAAQNENRLADALSLYTRAAELDPNNQAAVAGRADVQTLTGRAPVPSSLMNQQEQIINERRQSIQYAFRSAIQKANDAIAGHQFADAETAIANARAARDQDPTIFSTEEMRTFNSTISSTEQTLSRTRDQATIDERVRAQQEAEAQQRRQMQEASVSRQNTISDLIKAARRSIEEGKYDEAINILNQILTLDPNNDYALGVKPLVQDKLILLQQRTYREQFSAHLLGQLNNAEEKKIPYDDIVRYPENWPDISAERDEEVAESQGIDAEDRAVNQMLDRQIPEVHFDGTPFSDVITFFRNVTGANVVVKWNALNTVSVDKTTPVTEQFHNISFRTALTTVLGDLGSANAKIGYKVSDGLITISTADDLQGTPIAEVYDISDLLVQHENFQNVPFINIANVQAATPGGGNQTSSLQASGQPNPQELEQQREKTTQSIITALHDSISDGSWRDTGNGQGTITRIEGQNQLIVAQSPENHQRLAKLLALMRENQGLQVNIEARFLTVNRNFLDAVGLNLGFLFNTQNPAQVQTVNGVPQHVPGTGVFAPISLTTANDTFTNGVTASVPGALGVGGLSGVTGTTLGSLTGGAAYLSDFQVSLLLQATQATETSSTVIAPHVTVFNNQEAYIAVQTQTAYVGNLTAVTSAGVAAFQPQPAIIPTGPVLDVTPTVSPDHKYVIMNLHPQFSNLDQLVNFQFQTGAASSGGINGTGGATPSAEIQLPTVDVTDIHTIVSVPDGGTLLLGGETQASEDTREQGTPVLSKIPFLKRLFTNKAEAKGENILLILVKPTILVEREQEGRQFPLLNQKVGS
jgi:type II secretory pathway component GspD/PulD (secretin)/outer membrane protein assembly factor BamD (BamD/ComL family)